MFWYITLGVLAVVLGLAWLSDRKARRRHQLGAISETDSPRHGPEAMNEMYGFGVNVGKQGGDQLGRGGPSL